MRTEQEIIERIDAVKKGDWMGTQQSDLIECLGFEAARPYLKDSVTADEWEPLVRDRDSVIARMLDYMPFAWEKANDKRGLSAARSMDHYASWVWLAGDDLGDLTEYQYYGKDNLCRICEKYGWDAKQWDDGERTNLDITPKLSRAAKRDRLERVVSRHATARRNEMKEPAILPVKPGTVSDADKDVLYEAGVVVIEHEAPHELRLLRPGYDLPGGALLIAAAKALKTETGLSADAQRQEFGRNVADALIAAHHN